MTYPIEILQKRLELEKAILADHSKKLMVAKLSNSDIGAYKHSADLANTRIPQLEKAIEVLKKLNKQ